MAIEEPLAHRDLTLYEGGRRGHHSEFPRDNSHQFPPAKPNAWTSFWRGVVKFQSEKLNVWLAMRSTLGVVLPIAAGVMVGRIPSGLVVATGALNVCFSDGLEPYVQRARRMLAASVLVGLAIAPDRFPDTTRCWR